MHCHRWGLLAFFQVRVLRWGGAGEGEGEGEGSHQGSFETTPNTSISRVHARGSGHTECIDMGTLPSLAWSNSKRVAECAYICNDSLASAGGGAGGRKMTNSLPCCV